MPALQTWDLLSSDSHARDQRHAVLRQRRDAREPVVALGAFAQEFHRRFVAAEREALSHELARFDLDIPAIEVEGERYHRVLRCETTDTKYLNINFAIFVSPKSLLYNLCRNG